MGWGITFALDKNVIYCADGCKWKYRLPLTYSGCQYVLDYFENEIHSELDMARDEFPGTPAGLREACEESVLDAIHAYECLSYERKEELRQAAIDEMKSSIDSMKYLLKVEKERYKDFKKAFEQYKPSTRKVKYRLDELKLQMEPIQLEMNMEQSADTIEYYRASLRYLYRAFKNERLKV